MNLPDGWGFLADLMELLAADVPSYAPGHPRYRTLASRCACLLTAKRADGSMRHDDKLQRLPGATTSQAWAYHLGPCADVIRASRVYRREARAAGVETAPAPMPASSTVDGADELALAALENVTDDARYLWDGSARNPRALVRNGSDGAMVNVLPGRLRNIVDVVASHLFEPLVAEMDRVGLGAEPRERTPKARLRTQYPDDAILVHISTRDIHVGEPGDLASYRQYVVDCVAETLQRATYAHGRLDRVLVTIGSDLCTVDTAARTTTRGTYIPGAHSVNTTMDEASTLVTDVIETCRRFADGVDGIVEQGNHDTVTSWAMGLHARAWFRDCADVEIIMPAQGAVWTCYTWRDVMIASHHGHVKGVGDVAKIVPAMFPAAWGAASWRYCLLGHRHHTARFPVGDDGGLEIIQTRSISRETEYEHRMGYTTPASLESFVFVAGRGLTAHYRAHRAA